MFLSCRRSRRFGGPNGGDFGGAKDTFCLTDEGKELAALLSQQQQQAVQQGGPQAAAAAADADEDYEEYGSDSDGGADEPFHPYAAAAGNGGGAGASPAFAGRGRRVGGGAAASGRGGTQRGPTQANRGGILCDWEDDIGGLFGPGEDAGYDSDSSPAAAAAAAASTRRSAAGVPAAAAGGAATAMPARRTSAAAAAGSPAARRQLLPKVKVSERLLPLCPKDKCAECDTLRSFKDGEVPMMQIAGLSKAKQQHVKQVAGWLAAPEGGGHVLSVSDGPGAWVLL